VNAVFLLIIGLLVIFVAILFVLQQKHASSAGFYRSMIDYSSDWIWQVDLKPRFTYSNHAIENTLGYTQEDVFGRYPFEFVPEWEQSLLKQKIRDHIDSQKPFHHFQITALHRNGNLVFLETNAVPIFHNGMFSGYRGVTRDITESKLKEQKIEAQQIRLELAQESASMGIWDWQPGSDQVFFSPAYYSMLGYKPYEFQPTFQSWESLLHPDDMEHSKAYVQSFLDSGNEIFEIEFRLKNKQGDYTWIMSRGKVIEKDFNQQVVRLVGIHIDITAKKEYEHFITAYNKKLERKVNERTKSLLELNKKLEVEVTFRKKAQESLVKSETFFINLVENLPEPVFVVNSSDRVIINNKSYIKLFSTGNQVAAYPSCISEFPDHIAINIHLAKSKLNDLEQIHSFETTLVNDNAKKWLVFYINKLAYYNDEVLLLGIIRDVSEIKQAESELSRALRMERELNSLRTQFISTVSHEFRTPLAGIRNVVLMIHRYYDKWNAEKRGKKINQVYQSIDSMKTMLDDISLLGRELSGRLGYNPVQTNILDLLKSIRDEIINTTNHKHLQADFKTSLKGMNVLIDRNLLRQVLVNLLNNAVKYSDETSEIRFEAGKVKNNSFFYFIVQDQGIGIPSNELHNIFLPFYRASNAKNKKGTGLGMAIVKKLTEIQSGEVHIDSEPGKGTRVTLKIPYERLV
jgi:PAS domain S-box-containing protein